MVDAHDPADRERVLAHAAIAAEDEVLDALTALPTLPGDVPEPSRSRRHGLLQRLVYRLDPRDPSNREVFAKWAEANRLCWSLAMTASKAMLSMECRRRAVASRTVGPGDLRQQALIGLYRAACRFEPGRGLRFTTYARWWVRAELNVALQDALGAVRVPDSALRAARRAPPSAAPPWSTRSLDERLDGAATPAKDQLPGADPIALVERRSAGRALARAMAGVLTPRKRGIVAAYYGLDDGGDGSFREIGERIGLSGERVRQLHHEALRTLRRALLEPAAATPG